MKLRSKQKRKQKMKKIRKKLSSGALARRSGSLSVSMEGEEKVVGEKITKRKSFRKIENEHGVFQDVVTEELV